MSGSNGSSAHRGGQHVQQWPPETEDQARARAIERFHHLQQQGHARGYPPADGADPAAYGDPQQAPHPHHQGHPYPDQGHGHYQQPPYDPGMRTQPPASHHPASHPGGTYGEPSLAGPAPGHPHYGYGAGHPQPGHDPHAAAAQPGHMPRLERYVPSQHGEPSSGYEHPPHDPQPHPGYAPHHAQPAGYPPPFEPAQPTFGHGGPETPRTYPPQHEAHLHAGQAPHPGHPHSGHPHLGQPHPGQPHPGQPHPGHGYAPQPPAYDPRTGEHRPEPDPFDLSNYPPTQPPHGWAGQAGPDAAPPPAPGGHPGWPPGAGQAEPSWDRTGGAGWAPHHPGMRPDDPRFEAAGHPTAPHYGHDQGHDPHAAHDLRGSHDPHSAYYGQQGEQGDFDPDAVEPEQERRGPSTLVIVGALVGAIIAGGGLAYGYKLLGGGGGAGAKPPVVEAAATPARIRPDNPGGKSIDHNDKTFLNRLSSEPAPVPTSLRPPPARSSAEAEAGPKRVATTTIIVNRDGSVTPESVGDQPSIGASSGVPGLLIDGLGPPPAPVSAPALTPSPQRAAIPPPPLPRPSPPPPAAAPVVARAPVISRAPVVARLNDAEPAAAESDTRTPVPRRTSARDDLLAPKSNVGAAPTAALSRPAAAASNGYVAVLASKRNRQAALNSFADMFQKYPDVLGGLTPDVRQVNLADKGTWYRLIVGPPGSREAARDLCVKLKARGMSDCWPVAF